MQSQQKTDLKTVIEFLATKFPESFSIKGAAKPLKIGIFNDIASELSEEDPVSKTQVRHALRRYTNSWRYLEAVEKGGMRVDLAGQDVEALTSEHVEHAKAQLAESKAKFDEKRKAQAKKDAPKRPTKAVKNPPKRKAKPVEKAADKELQPVKELVSNEDFSEGTSVLVKLGMKPMAATIVEASKGEVSVQLSSGMVMKVSKDSIFKA
ncbi:RNA chaperone ProQ [Psychrosphaera aestuarii]|uniref:RNA chaperone ProQ n=1 Tax=Psychrosphaera aestuarii TaxID=1266052 RepID=UPI001B33CE87|nr:RNA chaperone ProQ [Psychrosphaera aestuarii]